jgi:hypothetical protein
MHSTDWREWPFTAGEILGFRIEAVTLEEAQRLPRLGRDPNELHQNPDLVRRLLRILKMPLRTDEKKVVVSLGHIISLVSGAFTSRYGNGIEIEGIDRLRTHAAFLTGQPANLVAKVEDITKDFQARFKLSLRLVDGMGEGRLIAEAVALARKLPLRGMRMPLPAGGRAQLV